MKVFNKSGIFDPSKPNTPANCKSTYVGKYNKAKTPPKQTKESKHLQMLKDAEERLSKDDYITRKQGMIVKDFAQRQADQDMVKELNIYRATEAHKSAKMVSGAWISEKQAEQTYGLLSTTLQRLSHSGVILKHSDCRLYSVPSIELHLNDIL